MNFRKLIFSSGFLFGAFLLAPAQQCRAEILKTGTGVFQTTDGRGKVVLSRDEPGILIAYGDPVDVQLFDPSLMKSDKTEHVFIRFNPALNGYVALIFGKKKSYRVVGSLTFVIGKLRVGLDNANAYLSISEMEGDDEQAGVLGIRGLEPVARYKGTAAQALLEANRLSPYRGVVKNFMYQGGELSLDGHPVQTSAIGITLDPPKNVCLDKKGRIYLNPKELAKIRATSDPAQRVVALDKILLQQKKGSPLDLLLTVKITEESVIALDYEQGRVVTIKPHTTDSDNQICLIEELAL